MDNNNPADDQSQNNPIPQKQNDEPTRPVFQTIEEPANDSSPFAPANSQALPGANTAPPANTEVVSQPVATEVPEAQQPEEGGKKFTKKTIFAGIITVLVLTGGLIGAVLLVRQPQDIREEAASGAECTHAADCILLESPGNQGTYSTSEPIKFVDITARDYHRYNIGDTDDGCYRVSIAGKNLSWERVGSGPNCKDISNIQIWLGQEQSTPSPSPTSSPTGSPSSSPTASPTGSPLAVSARCSEIKAYDTNWTQLSYQELSQLSGGEIIRFTVSGVADSGTFDKARFTINGIQRAEVTQQKPGSQEFYDEYVIPEETVNFSVDAQVHHAELNKWY